MIAFRDELLTISLTRPVTPITYPPVVIPPLSYVSRTGKNLRKFYRPCQLFQSKLTFKIYR
jgi:hypothetical protein